MVATCGLRGRGVGVGEWAAFHGRRSRLIMFFVCPGAFPGPVARSPCVSVSDRRTVPGRA